MQATGAAMSKKRLAIITSRPVYYYIALYRLIDEYPDIDLTVIYTTGVGRGLDEGSDLNRYRSGREELQGYRYIYLPGADRVTRLMGLRSLNWHIVPHLLRERYDVVWIHGYTVGTNMLAALVQGLLLRGTVWLRDDQHLRNPRSRWKQRLKRAVLPLLFRRWVGLRVGTLNGEWLEYFGIPASRQAFVPHAVELPGGPDASLLPEPDAADTDRLWTILAVGRAVWEKNYGTVLEAIARIKPLRMVRLVIVGDGPELEALMDTAARLGLSCSDVEFAGRVDQKDIAAYYRSADLFVLASVSETWGLVVNEAMSMGLPVVVSSRVGCSVDLVKDGENGYVIPPGDASELGQAILRVIENVEAGRPFGECSRQIVSQWSNETAFQGVLEAMSHER